MRTYPLAEFLIFENCLRLSAASSTRLTSGYVRARFWYRIIILTNLGKASIDFTTMHNNSQYGATVLDFYAQTIIAKSDAVTVLITAKFLYA